MRRMSPMQAAAQLYRLAQATALIRAYRNAEDLELRDGKIVPTDADHRAAEREPLELAALARLYHTAVN